MASTEHLGLREIVACLFDVFVFGTVFDWCSTISRQSSAPVKDCFLKIAMVAAHKYHLAAASVGFKTVYMSRPAEDSREGRHYSEGSGANISHYTAKMQFVVVGEKSMSELPSRALRDTKIPNSYNIPNVPTSSKFYLDSVVVAFRCWNRIRRSFTIMQPVDFNLKLTRTVLESLVTSSCS
ncbi:hypothetical protein BDR04DRAFT_1118295 [Suillus decipiens]|nr:hypothetical protein BDR04DRAFT_1118295 [Suillus decipiens]